MSVKAELRLLALYPEQMNIYADRGNILFLQRRCEWRGIPFEYEAILSIAAVSNTSALVRPTA